MYIVNDIAYSGNHYLEAEQVKVLYDYFLWVKFNDGQTRVFDFSTLLEKPVFVPLKDKKLFDTVYIEYGVPVWNNGEIDIAPEYIYENGTAV